MNKSYFRKRKPINYYEPDEPSFDEYIYCEKCYDFVYEYCAIHGPLLAIPDNKVTSRVGIPAWVPRAALTTPTTFLHIAPSKISGAGLGIFSSLTLPLGVRFGPYRGKHTDVVNSMYCWQIRSNSSYITVDGSDSESSNWMRYVNCARHWHEQNLVAYQYQGKIYYRTIKIIPKYTELLVFYGGEFAHALGIDLKNYNNPQKITVDQYIIEDIPKPVEPINNTLHVFNTEVLEILEETPNIDNRQEIEESTIMNTRIERATCSEFNNNLNTDKAQHNFDTTLEKSGKELICDVCYKIVRRRNFKRHKKIHEKKSLICSQCTYKTNVSQRFKIHMKYHTKDEMYECDTCNYVAYNKSYFRRHYRTIHKKVLSTLEDLNRYEKNIAAKFFLYNCKKCEYKTNFNNNLLTHLETHKSEFFQCDLCSYGNAVRNNLVKHLKSHK